MKKKNEARKLRLSRETLQLLTSSDIRKAAGASVGISCPSNGNTICIGGGGHCPMDNPTSGAC